MLGPKINNYYVTMSSRNHLAKYIIILLVYVMQENDDRRETYYNNIQRVNEERGVTGKIRTDFVC